MSDQAEKVESGARGVRLAILNNRIQGIAGKMHNTLLRTARSGVINNGRDFSCCILTADARLLAVGESLPIHVMVGADLMAQCMNEFHPNPKAGQAFLHNSPYHGCSHAADHSILVPVMDDAGVHRFTVMAKAHQADIGNSVPTTYLATARDVYEEGALIFPAVKVQEDYRDIEDIIRFAMMRIRVPEQWRGDYLASLGAARIGERELRALGAEVGWDALERHVDDWFDYSEQRMAGAIRNLPAGQETAFCVHDALVGTPPEGVRVEATVRVDHESERLEIDLRNNLDCMPNGLNLSEACSRSAALIGLFNGLGDPSVPTNSGSFRRIHIALRENCAIGIPLHPTSCSVATSNVADRLISAVQMAMAQLGDGLGMAEIGGCQTAGQAVISGLDPRRGNSPYINQLIMGDTLGAASPSEDGWLTLITGGTSGLGLLDCIEVNELRHPFRVAQRRLMPDTEGAGRLRGAPGMLIEFGPVAGDMRVVYQSDGTDNPAKGVRGGHRGGRSRNFKRTRSGEQIATGTWADIELAPGESVLGICCGGGGYGSPLERDPQRVKEDVDEGYVSRERAHEVYGVVLDEHGAVQAVETETQRRILGGQQ